MLQASAVLRLLKPTHGCLQEGYALDWSPAAQGWLAAGDCAGHITLLEPGTAGKWAPSEPLKVRP